MSMRRPAHAQSVEPAKRVNSQVRERCRHRLTRRALILFILYSIGYSPVMATSATESDGTPPVTEHPTTAPPFSAEQLAWLQTTFGATSSANSTTGAPDGATAGLRHDSSTVEGTRSKYNYTHAHAHFTIVTMTDSSPPVGAAETHGAGAHMQIRTQLVPGPGAAAPVDRCVVIKPIGLGQRPSAQADAYQARSPCRYTAQPGTDPAGCSAHG